VNFERLVAIHDKKETRITPVAGQYRLATLESDGRRQYGELFAAAPEMLEALKKARTCASIPDYVMELIVRAIRKAEVSDIGQVAKP
jgi:hypothetical protein